MDRISRLDQFLLDDYAGIGTDVVEADTSSAQAVAEAARRVAGSQLVGLTSVYEYFTGTAAEAAALLGVPGPDPASVVTSRSKVLTRAAVAKLDPALNPRYALSNSVAEAEAAAALIGFPVVVKPVELTGSVYVRRCDSVEDVRRVATHILSTSDYLGVSMTGTVAVEEFLAGPEYSVEMFAGRPVGVTAKSNGPLPYFVELAHRFPAPAPSALIEAVEDIAVRALRATGLQWGPAHVEVKFTDDTASSPRLVEVNPRVAGDRIPELVRLATGIDLTALHMAAVLGAPEPPRAEPVAGGAAIRFVETPDKGRLTAISGVERARSAPGVTEVHLKNVVGDVCFSHGSNRDRVAHVIATGTDADAALDRAANGAALLELQWAQVDGELAYV